MKIRVMGTRAECNQAIKYYQQMGQTDDNILSYSISALYPNRGLSNLYRVYIELIYKESALILLGE